MNIEFMRVADICRVTGDSRTTVYEKIRGGLLPKLIKSGARSSVVPSNEIYAVNAARVRGESDEAIRSLVVRMNAKRKLAGLGDGGYE